MRKQSRVGSEKCSGHLVNIFHNIVIASLGQQPYVERVKAVNQLHKKANIPFDFFPLFKCKFIQPLAG